MLSKTAQKFVNENVCDTYTDSAGRHIVGRISYGKFSSREENGVKVRDATLFSLDGKPIAYYDAATDEVYTA